MSEEAFETLTDSGGSPEAGDSSSPDPSTGELFETMDIESPDTLPTEEPIQEEAAKEDTLQEEKEAKETETQEKPKETPEEPEEKTEETDKLEPFHKHPRFQEMNKTIKELRAQVEQLTAKPAEETPEDLGYRGTSRN